MDFGDGNHFGWRGWREEIGGCAGKESFAGAWRAGDENIVMASDGDRKGAFGKSLTANMVKNRALDYCFCFFYNSFWSGGFEEFLAFEVQEKLA